MLDLLGSKEYDVEGAEERTLVLCNGGIFLLVNDCTSINEMQ
jgi:hypothetical protein